VRQGIVRSDFRMETRIFPRLLTLLTLLTLVCSTFLVFRFPCMPGWVRARRPDGQPTPVLGF